MSFLASLGQVKLKPTETKVTQVASTAGVSVRKHDGVERRVLVLSRHFCGDLFKWVGPFATQVLLTSHHVKRKLESLKHAYAAVESFADFDGSALVELRAAQLHKQQPFTHVVALIEQELLRAARIRELLGIKTGLSVAATMLYRDKIRMKEVAKEHGVAVPTFAAADYASDIVRFSQQHGFPIVCKPRRGHSSIGAKVIDDEKELEEYLATLPDADEPLGLDVETFVRGTMYHVDGMVWQGQLRFVWPSRYVNTCVGFKNNRFLASVSLSPNNELVPRLQKFVTDVVKALDGDRKGSYPIHGEVWHTTDDRIVLCEIGCRAGGADVVDQVRELFDVHLHQCFVDAQCDVARSWDKVPAKPLVDHSVGWVYVYPKVGLLKSLPEECDLDCSLLYNPVGKGQEYWSTDSCVDAAATFLIKGPSESKGDGKSDAKAADGKDKASAAAAAASSDNGTDPIVHEAGAVENVQRTFRWFEEKAEWAALPAEKKAEA